MDEAIALITDFVERERLLRLDPTSSHALQRLNQLLATELGAAMEAQSGTEPRQRIVVQVNHYVLENGEPIFRFLLAPPQATNSEEFDLMLMAAPINGRLKIFSLHRACLDCHRSGEFEQQGCGTCGATGWVHRSGVAFAREQMLRLIDQRQI